VLASHCILYFTKTIHAQRSSAFFYWRGWSRKHDLGCERLWFDSVIVVILVLGEKKRGDIRVMTSLDGPYRTG
jgi:hypothetical protein